MPSKKRIYSNALPWLKCNQHRPSEVLFSDGLRLYFTIHLVAVFWLKNAPATLKILARCPTLLRFAFKRTALKIYARMKC